MKGFWFSYIFTYLQIFPRPIPFLFILIEYVEIWWIQNRQSSVLQEEKSSGDQFCNHENVFTTEMYT